MGSFAYCIPDLDSAAVVDFDDLAPIVRKCTRSDIVE